ncbi:MAG: hypothetical protein OHK0017_10510 [Patescibacteria group bacterium]
MANLEDEFSPDYNPLIGGTIDVKVYFTKKDTSNCDSVIVAPRRVNPGNIPEQTLMKLFKGPILAEASTYQGMVGSYKGYDEVYRGLKIDNGVAYVDFKSEIIDTKSKFFIDFRRSCNVSHLNQITLTLKQFPEITKVVYSIDGSPRKFMTARSLDCNISEINDSYRYECLEKVPE